MPDINSMTRTELNERLRYAGLKKVDWGRLIGYRGTHTSTLGAAHKVPFYGETILKAWEIMTPDQRRVMMEDAEARSMKDAA